MVGYLTNIETKSLENEYFREVLFTGTHSQLVVMSLAPGEDIGLETHDDVDQFIRVEGGQGKAILDGEEQRSGGWFGSSHPGRDRAQHHQQFAVGVFKALFNLLTTRASAGHDPQKQSRGAGLREGASSLNSCPRLTALHRLAR